MLYHARMSIDRSHSRDDIKMENRRIVFASTQTNRDPNRDKTIARSNQQITSKPYRRQDGVFGYELQLLLSGALPVFQNLNYKTDKTV